MSTMSARSYYRVMLGHQGEHAAECFAGGFVGADFDIEQDLTYQLPNKWRQFNAKFISAFLADRPAKTKIGTGLVCGAIWTVAAVPYISFHRHQVRFKLIKH